MVLNFLNSTKYQAFWNGPTLQKFQNHFLQGLQFQRFSNGLDICDTHNIVCDTSDIHDIVCDIHDLIYDTHDIVCQP